MAEASTSTAPSQITVRLHVSGIDSSSHSRSDLEARFSSFGEVLRVDRWPPAQNAIGDAQKYAYVTLRAPEEKVKRAISLLSGTIWKGSKIGVAKAKKDFKGAFGEATEDGQVQGKSDKSKSAEEKEAKKKRKARPLGQGREDRKVARQEVITEEDVKAGKLWGWRLTPAGHLLRPMQMRPSHPLALPKDNPKSSSKTKKKRASNSKVESAPKKPITRAFNQTIDPTRYGAVHLSENMLGERDVSSSELWVCEESDTEPGKVRWIRKIGDEVDVEEFQTQRQPRAQSPSSSDETTMSADSASSSSSSALSSTAGSESELESEASSSSSSEGTSDDDEKTAKASSAETKQHQMDESPADHLNGSFSLQPYDPDEDDVFSDGYNEEEQVARVTKQLPPSDDRDRNMSLLEQMFGTTRPQSTTFPQASVPEPQESDDEDDSSEGEWWQKRARSGTERQEDSAEQVHVPDATSEPEDSEHYDQEIDEEGAEEQSQDGGEDNHPVEAMSENAAIDAEPEQPKVGRRGALLAAMRAAVSEQQQPALSRPSFQPVSRFEPVGGPDVVMSEDEQTHKPASAQEDNAKVVTSDEPVPPAKATTEVEMGQLKDMFKPQEGSGGFSLFGAGGLALGDDELELEDEPDEPLPTSGFAYGYGTGMSAETESGRREIFRDDEERPTTSTATTSRPLPFFFPLSNPSSPLSPLVLLTSQASSKAFWQRPSEEEIKRKWEERKANLTQDYKRRHREAVKKKRRKVVGSRRGEAAGMGLSRGAVDGGL